MSRVLFCRLLIVLLLCLSWNLTRGLNNRAPNNDHEETGEDKNSDSLINELSTGSSTSSVEDPAESSETIVYNRFANPPDAEENRSSEEEYPEGPADHAIPYSEHELSKEVPTKPKYTAPGKWARPTKPRDVSSEEVPSRLYAQVRRTHTVRRLPRKRAFENAKSEEERENAARLRKVVRNSKVNTVYTEEGYEDSAYDHAGHVRDADFDEGYARKVKDQLSSRKNSGDGDDIEEKSRRPEKYKDYDNGDNYETTTDRRGMDDEETRWTKSGYPKLVAETGTQKLQEDLEREVEEIEKGVEISKLGGASSKQESVTSSPKGDYRRKSHRDRSGKRRKLSSTEELDEDSDEKVGEQSENSRDNYEKNYSILRTPVDREVISLEETTTMANNIEMLTNGPSETYRYLVEANPAAGNEIIDFQGGQNPTTVSYSQLFWDYFKAQQNQYTTLSPFIVESATVSPNVLPPSPENAFPTYSAYVDSTTPFPVVDPAMLNPQQLAQTLVDPRYSEQQQIATMNDKNEQDFNWQPLDIQQPPKTGINDASSFVLEPTSNLDSEEASFDKVFSDPVTFINRKPRYKITMRRKSVRPVESSETATPNPVTENSKENTGSMLLSPNYVKMLTHLRNEEEAAGKQNSSPPRDNLYLLKWMEDLAKMRPPVFQRENSYQNFISHSPRGSVKLGSPLFRSGSAPLTRKRIVDQNGRKEGDHTKPKRNRNVSRPGFRPVAIEAISRSRARRRERRSPESGDETGGSMPIAKQSANNAAANRGEIERAAKHSLAERNPPRKVTRGVEVGPVPDTVDTKTGRPIHEKSRSGEENDRGKGSRGSAVGGVSPGEGESVSFTDLREEKGGKDPSELEASKDDREKVRIGGGSANWNGNDDGKKLRMSAMRRKLEEGLDRISGAVERGKKILRELRKRLNLTKASGTIEHDGKVSREVGEGFNQTSVNVGHDKKFLGDKKNGLNLTQTNGTVENDKTILWEKGDEIGSNQTNGSVRYDRNFLGDAKKGLNLTQTNDTVDETILGEKGDKIGSNETSESVGHDKNFLGDAKKSLNLTQTNVTVDETILGEKENKISSNETSESVGQGKKTLAVELKRSSLERDYNLKNMDGGSNPNKIEKRHDNVTDDFEIAKVVSEKNKEESKPRIISETSTVSEINEEEIDLSSKKIESEKKKENKETIADQNLLRPKRSHREVELHFDSNKTDEDLHQQESKSSHSDKVEEKVEKDPVKEDQPTMKSHEDLLQESPEITDDVINREIEARFNNEEEEDENDEEKKIEVEVPEVPDFDYVEEVAEEEDTDSVTTTESTVDKDKYPFYENEELPNPSALRYATDPEKVPGKTYGRMNFYKSRDVYKHCDEVEPNLDVLPEEEKPVAEKGVNENPQRLKGLGDKLDCFKAKYFDEDPFDNPLFLEKEVEDPLPHLEVNPKKFASRIMLFPKEDEKNVVQKSSKRPENHRNHKSQPRQRKPKSPSARAPRSRRVRIKSYSRHVPGSRLRVVKIKGSRVRYVKPRRPQKVIRRPLASASEVSSLYTPYQNQVYEDVMGTIKNMANSYQVEEITTVPTSKEAEVTEIDIVKTNTSSNTTKGGKKEKDRKSSSSEEHSSGSDVKVGGMAPPRYLNRQRLLYKRIRVPQKSRLQLVQVRPNGLRPINHRQRIIRYKRGSRDDDRDFFGRSELSELDDGSKEITSSEENAGRLEKGAKSLEKISNSTEKNRTSFSMVPELTEKSKAPETPSSGETEKPPKIYTIKDRIRYSKPKGEINKVEKFTNKSEVVEDPRRKEPKYNYIKRRRRPLPVPSTTELSLTVSTEPFLTATTHETIIEDRELIKENKNVHYFLNDTKDEQFNPPLDESNQSLIELSTVPTNKTGSGYAVREDLSEEQTTTQDPSEVSRSKSFFVSPSYADFSSEEFEQSIFSNDTERFDSPANLTDSKESFEKENNAPKTVHQSYFSDEEPSEKAESNTNAEPSKESEEGSASKSNDSKEGGTFFNYWDRPSSPAESYEDEKYKDLGPRLSKPAFFHPPFSFLKSRKSFFGNGSEEDSEESGEKDEYVFPWQRDKENEKKRRKRNRYYDKSIVDYEYPWERRERLARKRMDHEEDHDGARKYRRYANPRGRIRFWTRREDSSEENNSDNVSSETRPVKKYSSKYSSKKEKLLAAPKSKVEEISRSIKEVLERDEKSSEEKSKEKPRKEDSGEKKARGGGVSRGIVPEDVTLAPRRNGKKEAGTLLDPVAKNRSSTGLLRNSLDNGESSVKKAIQEILNSKREANSTVQQQKRRRRPVKSLSNVEITTKSPVNRGRRRQKMVTTPTISTTSSPRLARRKSTKSVDPKNANLQDKSSNDDLKTFDSPVERNVTMEHRVSDEIDTESRIAEEKDEAKKSTVEEVKDESNQGKNSSETEPVGNQEGHHGGGGDEVGESKVDPVNDDGKFDFMDERIEALSDFAKPGSIPGDDDEFGFDSIVKSDGGVTPHNRATQLSQQESREIISTKSWISQNYNF